jgi:hypothetical protein
MIHEQGLQLGIVVAPEHKPLAGLLPVLGSGVAGGDALCEFIEQAGGFALGRYGVIEAVERREVGEDSQILALIEARRLNDIGGNS